MKMSNYDNSVFPYPLHSTVNLPAWRPKDANVNLMSFPRLFIETSITDRKVLFSKLHDKCSKNLQIREELSASHFLA